MESAVTTADEARQLALAWANGQRTWWHDMSNCAGGRFSMLALPMTVIADAQEVMKWTAVAGMLAAAEANAPEPRTDPRGD